MSDVDIMVGVTKDYSLEIRVDIARVMLRGW